MIQGIRALLHGAWCMQDVAVGSSSGATSIREAVPHMSGIDVDWLYEDGLGDGSVAEQGARVSPTLDVSYSACWRRVAVYTL